MNKKCPLCERTHKGLCNTTIAKRKDYLPILSKKEVIVNG